jgi:hypothetical protein
MTSKQEITSVINLNGALTLKDVDGLGIKDVLIIVTDRENRRYALTTPGPAKSECLSGGGVEHAFNFSIPEGSGDRENGPPLPGQRNGPYEYLDYENCFWEVKSESTGGGDWIEKSRRCIGYIDRPYCRIHRIVEFES